jgi:hypothetical protein
VRALVPMGACAGAHGCVRWCPWVRALLRLFAAHPLGRHVPRKRCYALKRGKEGEREGGVYALGAPAERLAQVLREPESHSDSWD